MKVVFLDIDGVLNSYAYWKWQKARKGETEPKIINMAQWKLEAVDKHAVSRLNRLHEETGCVYVLSSTWRILESLEDMQALLEHHGFTGKLVDKTTTATMGDHTSCRGLQCAEWLSRHQDKNITSFICLDDDSDFANMPDRLVRTKTETGLLDKHVERAISLLNTDLGPDRFRQVIRSSNFV